jgi:hypothetical protein
LLTWTAPAWQSGPRLGHPWVVLSRHCVCRQPAAAYKPARGAQLWAGRSVETDEQRTSSLPPGVRCVPCAPGPASPALHLVMLPVPGVCPRRLTPPCRLPQGARVERQFTTPSGILLPQAHPRLLQDQVAVGAQPAGPAAAWLRQPKDTPLTTPPHPSLAASGAGLGADVGLLHLLRGGARGHRRAGGHRAGSRHGWAR